ncbi:MAG: hypothetical protein MMC33_004644 [Icmadophila ericetorum]|nr:hypothetical protein [Icmadophila ericetorum]
MSTSSLRPSAIIDHIVILLPLEDFNNIPLWLRDNFTIIEGGKHTTGRSSNKLIPFADGTYLELFTWTAPAPVGDNWELKKPGYIDFSITAASPPATPESVYTDVSSRLTHGGDGSLGVSFTPPIDFGRVTPEGQELKFKLLRRKFENAPRTPSGDEFFPTGRADIPFFCFDVTSRSARIPYTDPTKTTHPCGATGIHSVEILVPKEYLGEYLKLYESVMGTKPIPSDEGRGWDFLAGSPVDGCPERYVCVRAAEGDGERTLLKERGVGIGRVGLALGGKNGEGSAASSEMVPKGELGGGLCALRLI